MIFSSESDLASFAERFGTSLKSQKLPLCLELVGDVGAGKTTFTRALARGLGITEPVTSPSFTISKRYPFGNNFLAHYDFYRLQEPGLMAENLNESLNDPSVLTIIEWANTVANILPKNRITITFKVLKDGSRELLLASGEASRRGERCSSSGSFPPARTTTYIPDGADRFARRAVLPDAQCMTSSAETGDPDKSARPKALEANQTKTSNRKRTNQPIALYLDTSDFTAKIKLTDKTGQTFEYSDDLGRKMAEKLLETLENHLKDHGATFRDLEEITFMSGPGSFTGLRIGAAIVNTLTHELHIPLYDHHGIKHQIILPDYGRPANISQPKK